MNVCSQCDRDFTSVSAFDAHQTMRISKGKATVKCSVLRKHPKGHPTAAGKPVHEQKGQRGGRDLFRLADTGTFDWAKGQSTAPVPDETRTCNGCQGTMRKSKPGRGRWPSKCQGCGGTGTLVH